MKYTLEAYSIWEQGPREKQEDSIYPAHGKLTGADRLFILCDGMGGHAAGEIASRTVCSAMSSYLLSCSSASGSEFSDDDFRAALKAAYDALDSKDYGTAKKMGTTLTFLKLHDAGCTIAHIGDSRVYHIRPGKDAADTEILFQTEDHSLVNDLVKIGELTREEAKYSKQKNVITRAMQAGMERRPKADLYHSDDISPDDYFMLCSDGLLEQMDDENLKFIFSAKGGNLRNKIDILIKATAHNHDNHSAILVRIVDVKGVVPKVNPEKPELLMAQVEDAEVEPSVRYEEVCATMPQDLYSAVDREQHRPMLSSKYRTVKCFIYCLVIALVISGGYCVSRFRNSRSDLTTTEPKPAVSTLKPSSSVGSSSKANMPADNGRHRKSADSNQPSVSVVDSQKTKPAVPVEPIQEPSVEAAIRAESPTTVVPRSPMPAALPRINPDNTRIPDSDEQKVMNATRALEQENAE